jgi:hypothetical protein
MARVTDACRFKEVKKIGAYEKAINAVCRSFYFYSVQQRK